MAWWIVSTLACMSSLSGKSCLSRLPICSGLQCRPRPANISRHRRVPGPAFLGLGRLSRSAPDCWAWYGSWHPVRGFVLRRISRLTVAGRRSGCVPPGLAGAFRHPDRMGGLGEVHALLGRQAHVLGPPGLAHRLPRRITVPLEHPAAGPRPVVMVARGRLILPAVGQVLRRSLELAFRQYCPGGTIFL